MKNKLSPKQERFCQEYMIDLNATKAAIRAGYSSKTAYSIGEENLRKPEIKKFIQEVREKDAKVAEITRSMVLEGYRKLAFYDTRKFYNENGDLIDVNDLDDETSFALTSFEVSEEKEKGVVTGYVKKIKMSDRKNALDSICKVLGYNASEKFAFENFTDEQLDEVVNKLIEKSKN
jgi:phage terminase small subunit